MQVFKNNPETVVPPTAELLAELSRDALPGRFAGLTDAPPIDYDDGTEATVVLVDFTSAPELLVELDRGDLPIPAAVANWRGVWVGAEDPADWEQDALWWRCEVTLPDRNLAFAVFGCETGGLEFAIAHADAVLFTATDIREPEDADEALVSVPGPDPRPKDYDRMLVGTTPLLSLADENRMVARADLTDAFLRGAVRADSLQLALVPLGEAEVTATLLVADFRNQPELRARLEANPAILGGNAHWSWLAVPETDDEVTTLWRCDVEFTSDDHLTMAVLGTATIEVEEMLAAGEFILLVDENVDLTKDWRQSVLALLPPYSLERT